MEQPLLIGLVSLAIGFVLLFLGAPKGGTRACLQLGGLCTRTDQNQTRNTVLFCNAAGTLGIPKSVVE